METYAVPAELAAALMVAGYRVGGPAGVGGGGPVWTATRVGVRTDGSPARGQVAGAERVVVQVVDAPTEPDGGPLAARLRALGSLDHPHLARVVDVLDVAPAAPGRPGRWAVLLAEVPGATVAALLAARGRLTAGEVVTLVVPVAGALDALHRAGLVHGDVSPANVVVRPDGRPVLIDLLGDAGPRDGTRGTPGFVAPELVQGRFRTGAGGSTEPDGLPGDAPADVFALASVGLAALDLAATGGRLGQELAAGCAPEPVRRPTAAELAAVCYPCAPPEPIALPDAGVLARTALAQLAAEPRTVSAGGRSRHRARRASRLGRPGASGRREPLGAPRRGALRASTRAGGRRAAGLLLVGAAAAAVCAVTFGSLVRDGAAPSGPSAAVREATTPARGGSDGTTPVVEVADDPVAAAVTLTRRRAEVLAAGDPAALADVSRPGSGAHAADLALLADLRAADVRLEGLTAVVDGAAATTDGGSAAGGPPSGPAAVPQVDVTVRSGLSAHRRVTPDGVVDVPAQPVRDVVLRLALTGDGWRVEDVVAEG